MESALESLKVSGIALDSKSLKWIASLHFVRLAMTTLIPRDSIESPSSDEILWIASGFRPRNDDMGAIPRIGIANSHNDESNARLWNRGNNESCADSKNQAKFFHIFFAI